MMTSKASSVEEYLAELPADRRRAIEAVRAVILKNLDSVFEEGMQYGGIGYFVPHKVFPQGYRCDPKQPLPFAMLSSQKNHMALHLMAVYCNPELLKMLQADWADSGKKLDMGKACIRFKKLDDVPLDVIGRAIARVPAAKYIEFISTAIRPGSAKKKAKA